VQVTKETEEKRMPARAGEPSTLCRRTRGPQGVPKKINSKTRIVLGKTFSTEIQGGKE